MALANTLAYYNLTTITPVKSFIVQACDTQNIYQYVPSLKGGTTQDGPSLIDKY